MPDVENPKNVRLYAATSVPFGEAYVITGTRFDPASESALADAFILASRVLLSGLSAHRFRVSFDTGATLSETELEATARGWAESELREAQLAWLRNETATASWSDPLPLQPLPLSELSVLWLRRWRIDDLRRIAHLTRIRELRALIERLRRYPEVEAEAIDDGPIR